MLSQKHLEIPLDICLVIYALPQKPNFRLKELFKDKTIKITANLQKAARHIVTNVQLKFPL